MSQATQWGQQASGPATMAQISARANASFNALLSMHSGTSRPDYAVGGTDWLDTTGITIGAITGAWVQKLWDGADDIAMAFIDASNNAMWFDPSAPEVEIASASLTDLATLKSTRGVVSGDAEINSFGTAPNKMWLVRFTGAPTLRHNVSNIICPGGADYAVTAGTVMIVTTDAASIATIGPGMKADGTSLVGSTGGGGGDTGARAYPIGALFMWPSTTPPAGALVRDGSDVSRTTYAALFGLIGTTYGEGDGSTTFTLPNDLGLFERGWDNGRGYDPGRVFGSEQPYGQKSQFAGGTFTAYVPASGSTSGSVSKSGNADKGNVGSGANSVDSLTYRLNASSIVAADEVRPRNRAYLPCIQAL